MVQIIERGPSLGALSGQMLGQSLGQGLGQFFGDYRANKAFDEVINNPEMKDKPLSERWEALSQVARKHGPRGENFLKNQIMLEQQRQQEKSQKQESKLVQRILNGEEISDKELEGTRPELQIMAHKAKQVRAPLGGLSGQPVPQEISQKIPQILNENRGKSAEELAASFDAANIPRAYSNSYIETRRREDEIEGKQKSKEKVLFHSESQKFDEELQHQADSAKKQIMALEDITKSINTGKVTPFNTSNLFKGFGSIGEKISDALLNQDQAAINASIPQLLEGWKQVFGVRLSDADLKVLQDKLPSISKSPEANKAVIKVMKKYADMSVLKNKIAKEIKKENGGIRPVNFSSLVSDRFDEALKPIQMKFKKKDGEFVTVPIPSYKVDEALKGGGQLINE